MATFLRPNHTVMAMEFPRLNHKQNSWVILSVSATIFSIMLAVSLVFICAPSA